MRRVVVTAAYLAHPSTEPAVKFLSARKQKRHWPDLPEEDLGKMVEDVFLAASGDEIGALSCEVDPLDVDVLRTAYKHVRDWRVAE